MGGGPLPHGAQHDLQSIYGKGIGDFLAQFLSGGAGFNQQAINQLLASLQPGIERGTQSLMDEFSASGNRFGSGAQLGLGDYLSQVNLNEGQIEAGMYEKSLSDFLSVLTGSVLPQAAQSQANTPSPWDYISQALGIGGSAASGISAAQTASNPNANTQALDTIAGGLAGF